MKIHFNDSTIELDRPLLPPLTEEQVEDGGLAFDLGRLCLFSDPGQGKTLTALYAMAEMYNHNEGEGLLVICPQIALLNWAKWISVMLQVIGVNDTSVQCINKNSIKTLKSLHIVTTYGTVSRKNSKVAEMLKYHPYKMIIVDESQELSNNETNRTKAIYGDDGLFYSANWQLCLSGTPIPKYNDGLGPTLYAGWADVMKEWGFNDIHDFEAHFCVKRKMRMGNMFQSKLIVTGSKHEDELNKILYSGDAPIAVRRKLVLEQGWIENDILIPLKESHALRTITLEAIEGSWDEETQEPVMSPKRVQALKLLGEEKASVGAKYVSEKLSHMRKQGDNTSILALAWHTQAIDNFLEWMDNNTDYVFEYIDGSTNIKHNQKVQDQFNRGKIDGIIGQIQTMGVAIDLQHNCNQVVFVERDWSHAKQIQAIGRAVRRGQKQKVFVDFLTTENELELPKARVVKRKGQSAAKTLDSHL